MCKVHNILSNIDWLTLHLLQYLVQFLTLKIHVVLEDEHCLKIHCDVQMCNVCRALGDSWVVHHEPMCALTSLCASVCLDYDRWGPDVIISALKIYLKKVVLKVWTKMSSLSRFLPSKFA